MTILSQEKFIEQIESLPPLPAIVHRILTVSEAPNSSADDVARVLSEDPAIAAKILRVANSPFYEMSREVTQVSRAVVMLGSIAVRNLVLGICARDSMPHPAGHIPEHATLWRHSIAVGAASELIAREVGLRPPEEAFVAGLLHDIGQLAMVIFQPEAFRALLEQQGHGVGFLALEREQFGLDHTEAGFMILTRWGLPDPLCHIVRHHHEQEIDADGPAARFLPVVMLADMFAQMLGIGFDLPLGRFQRATMSASLLGLTESDQYRIIERLERRVDKAVRMLADTDRGDGVAESAVSKRALWISPDQTGTRCINQLFLEHHGYELRCVAPDHAAGDMPLAELVVINLPQEERESANRIAAALVQRGHHGIVLLTDPPAGEAARQCDPETGICRIPPLFTAFDLTWLKEHMKP